MMTNPQRGGVMLAEERQRQILAVARAEGAVDVGKLAVDLAVAPDTARRDLRLLEQRGLVRRTHGGAYPVDTAKFETTLAMRTSRRLPEKRRIAEAAVHQLRDAETVFLDEGFTPQLIAGALPADRPLTVVTASLTTNGDHRLNVYGVGVRHALFGGM
jgi:DeoR family transcriptional regulator, fructose operon transcriptional repressor